MILKNNEHINKIKEFCESMGLNQEQIDCILASNYTQGYNTELVNDEKEKTKKVLKENRSSLVSVNKRQALRNFFTKQKLKKSLSTQHLTLDEFLAIKSYTMNSFGMNLYAREGAKSYRQYILKLELFREGKNSDLLSPHILLKIGEKTKNKSDLVIDNKKIISKQVDKLLQTDSKGDLWSKQEIEDVLKDISDEVGQDVVDATVSVLYDCVNELSEKIKDYDTIKQTIGYKNDGLNKPTILHRINSMSGMNSVFGVELKDGETLTKNDVIGKVVNDDAFTSTSTLYCEELAKEGNAICRGGDVVYMDLLAPQGTKGALLSSIAHFSGEKEILLNPNSIYIYDAEERKDIDEIGGEIKVLKVYGIAISHDITSYPTKINEINNSPEEVAIKTDIKKSEEMIRV